MRGPASQGGPETVCETGVVTGEVFLGVTPQNVPARKCASDVFISRLVGVKGTPQHRSPSHEMRTPSFCLCCLAPPRPASLRMAGRLLRFFSLCHGLTRTRAYEAALWTCAAGTEDPGEACNAIGVCVREVLMLRIPGGHEHSDVHLHSCEAFSFRRLRPLRGRNYIAPRKACCSHVSRTSRVARCPFLATSVRTATVLVWTSQQSHSPKVNPPQIGTRKKN